MRYVFSILLIAIIFSLLTGFYVLHEKIPESTTEPVLVINDQVISLTEYDTLLRNNNQMHEDKSQFVESLITRELLVQEAIKMGIDQEEDFRRSLHNYYEQSLTRVLLEHKYDSFEYEPTRLEIERMVELQNYAVELTVQPVSGLEEEKVRHDGLFRDLATAMQVAVLDIDVGKISKPILVNNMESTIRLISLRKIPQEDDFTITSELARQIIAMDRQEQSLARWLIKLRNNAIVNVPAAIINEESTRDLVENRSSQ